MTETAARSDFRNLWVRTATGIVLLLVAIGALYAGKGAFWLLATFLAAAMMVEWGGLMRAGAAKSVIAAALILALLIYAHPSVRLIDMTTLAALLGGAIATAAVTMNPKIGGGFLYIGLGSLAIVFLREQGGLVLTLWALAVVWATDIGAYFSGKSIGGPKLAPALSPNKTWAGLIGGMISAVLVSAIFAWFGSIPMAFVPFAAGLAVLAQLGDLYESWLKRRADVKDSSNLFPGHGGALDRLDGLLPVAICVAGLAAAGAIA
ncbi:phosphatidate cytidylyltransferase [Parasphingopyxis marina]|uniref:Phosphatidate cytidylyltransferase n=1 Tax=Parasphingopyxis marina TaxID=2761622 RepID=A0A842HZQ1_9SPHN|nr:phosphatidate cytidylyltransferase [Parasphingopyxis marina]MBC2777851.1 phosphatidate cytidylyltransferase [Parasphingopyxis marina]